MSEPHPVITRDLEQGPELIDVQRQLHPLLGSRYRLLAQLGGERSATASPSWRTYLAQDASLRRRVVLRMASRECGDTNDLHERVERARYGAAVNSHLIAGVYDAFIVGAANRVAPPATTAIIIGEYLTGPDLESMIAQGVVLDAADILAALTRRVAEAAELGLSFGVLRTSQVILTEEGPAIAALPVGRLDEIGPTSLDELAARLVPGPFSRAVRHLGFGTRRGSRRGAHAA